MRTNIMDWINMAHENQFAIPAFNFSGFWEANAVLEAAKEEKAPVMIMSLTLMSDAGGIAETAGAWRGLADAAAVPVGLHLDHCMDLDKCEETVLYNYDSVMADSSKYSLEENISRTKRIVDFAHKHGVYVEAEIGKIMGNTVEGEYVGDDYLVQVNDAVELVKNTDVDFLAVGIGTAHGFYVKEPKINFERLAEVDDALGIPLVMHGGTGVPQEDVKEAIRLGISKVNVGTEILTTYTNNLRKKLIETGENAMGFDIIHPAIKEIKEIARKWIRVCMANGRVK